MKSCLLSIYPRFTGVHGSPGQWPSAEVLIAFPRLCCAQGDASIPVHFPLPWGLPALLHSGRAAPRGRSLSGPPARFRGNYWHSTEPLRDFRRTPIDPWPASRGLPSSSAGTRHQGHLRTGVPFGTQGFGSPPLSHKGEGLSSTRRLTTGCVLHPTYLLDLKYNAAGSGCPLSLVSPCVGDAPPLPGIESGDDIVGGACAVSAAPGDRRVVGVPLRVVRLAPQHDRVGAFCQIPVPTYRCGCVAV